VCTQAAKTHLHFVGNTNSARDAHMTIDLAEISGRKTICPATLGRVSAMKAATFPPSWSCVPKSRPRGWHIWFPDRLHRDDTPAVIVGNGCDVDPGLASATARAIELVRADIDERAGVAVIGVLQDNYIFASRIRSRKTQS